MVLAKSTRLGPAYERHFRASVQRPMRRRMHHLRVLRRSLRNPPYGPTSGPTALGRRLSSTIKPILKVATTVEALPPHFPPMRPGTQPPPGALHCGFGLLAAQRAGADSRRQWGPQSQNGSQGMTWDESLCSRLCALRGSTPTNGPSCCWGGLAQRRGQKASQRVNLGSGTHQLHLPGTQKSLVATHVDRPS